MGCGLRQPKEYFHHISTTRKMFGNTVSSVVTLLSSPEQVPTSRHLRQISKKTANHRKIRIAISTARLGGRISFIMQRQTFSLSTLHTGRKKKKWRSIQSFGMVESVIEPYSHTFQSNYIHGYLMNDKASQTPEGNVS